MAFGLTHWLASFIIFLIVLTIITWSAVHLSKKSDQKNTDIAVKFLEMEDYPIQKENKSLSFAIVHKSTPLIETTNSPTLFANHQGLQISDSAEFYKIMQALSLPSARNRTISSTKDDTTTAISTSFINNNNTIWIEDVTAAVYNQSDEVFSLNSHRQNVNQKEIQLPNYILQIMQKPLRTSGGAEFSDTNKLRKSDAYQSVGMELSDFLQDRINGISNASVAFSYVSVLPIVKQSDIVKYMETTQSLKNERFETSMVSSYFYTTMHYGEITKNP